MSIDGLGLGPRVPLLVISPYAKRGYVSHTTYTFESVLRTFEEIARLPALTERDRSAPDLLDSFDFHQKPAPPLVLRQHACAGPTKAQFQRYLPAAVTQAVFQRVRRVQDELGGGPDTFGLIHADIHQKNYLFCDGQLRLIDFDDSGWGHYLYDFAVTLNEGCVRRPRRHR